MALMYRPLRTVVEYEEQPDGSANELLNNIYYYKQVIDGRKGNATIDRYLWCRNSPRVKVHISYHVVDVMLCVHYKMVSYVVK